MRVRAVEPRRGFQAHVESLGFRFHSLSGPYWTERAYVELTADEARVLDDATRELTRLVCAAVEHVVERDRFAELGIAAADAPLVARSWRAREPSLYGRFDLRFDGASPPKMLEFNADTPTSLVESSVVQRDWREAVLPDAGQANRLEELLTARLSRVLSPDGDALHLAFVEESLEDADTIELLARLCRRGGHPTTILSMEEIGWSAYAPWFVDPDGAPIVTLFKLYPWEWLLAEEFAPHLRDTATRLLEPAWKLVPSSKGILAILWELFPDHPNLLPASLEPSAIGPERATKPLFSREGANVRLESARGVVSQAGGYGAEGFVHQALAVLPRFDQGFVVTGAWVVGDEPAGLGFRASPGPITDDTSQFLPHVVR